MEKGDIILTPFPFTDLKGVKNRPAVVLFANELDATISFITSELKWQEDFDVTLNPSNFNGLKVKSLIRLNKIATVDTSIIIGLLGKLEKQDLTLLNSNLKMLLKL